MTDGFTPQFGADEISEPITDIIVGGAAALVPFAPLIAAAVLVKAHMRTTKRGKKVRVKAHRRRTKKRVTRKR